MGGCLSLSRVSDEPLPAEPAAAKRDGRALVGVGAAPVGGARAKGVAERVRELVPAAVLPPRSGPHAYEVVGDLSALPGPAAGCGCGAARLLRHRRTGELVASRWIDFLQGEPAQRAPRHPGVGTSTLQLPWQIAVTSLGMAMVKIGMESVTRWRPGACAQACR